MKKTVLFALLLVALISAPGYFFVRWLMFDPEAPRFVAAKAGFDLGPQEWVSYEFLDARPFEGGKMWITSGSSNNYRHFLFDIENRRVLGELLNAEPDFMSSDQSRLVCKQRAPVTPVAMARIKGMILDWLARFPRLKKPPSHTDEDQESFWMLDVNRGTATRLGLTYQRNGAISYFQSSPNFRFSFNQPVGSLLRQEFFLCDVNAKRLRRDAMDGVTVGWWDEQRILIKTRKNDFGLYDVKTLKTSPFLTGQQIRAFYDETILGQDTNRDAPFDPATATPFYLWNGRENDFYITEGNKHWFGEESFLVKIERPNGGLKLLDPHFKFGGMGHFDPTGNYYLYRGTTQDGANSAVYLRDLNRRQTRQLVSPDVLTKSFNIPRFYRGEVIYARSNALWRIKLDGSDDRRLFPPLEAAP